MMMTMMTMSSWYFGKGQFWVDGATKWLPSSQMSTHLKSKGTLIIWSLFAPKKGPIWSIRTNWFIEQLIGPVGFWHAGCSLDGASTYTLYLAKNIITICVSTASCHILLSDDFGTKEIDSMWLSLSSYLSFPKAISSSWNWFALNICSVLIFAPSLIIRMICPQIELRTKSHVQWYIHI